MAIRRVTGLKDNKRTAMQEREYANARDYRRGKEERQRYIATAVEEVRSKWRQQQNG